MFRVDENNLEQCCAAHIVQCCQQYCHRLDILTRCLTEKNLCPRFLRCLRQLASAFVRLPRQLASDLLASQELASVACVRFACVTKAGVTKAGKCRSRQICYLVISRVQYVISRIRGHKNHRRKIVSETSGYIPHL